MKINRRSFFAALAAPLLAPLRRLLPKPAAPVLNEGDVIGVTITGNAGVHHSLLYFWGRDGLYILDGDCKTVISRQPYVYWHGQPPFVFLGATLAQQKMIEHINVTPPDPKFEHKIFSMGRGACPAPEA